MMNQETLGPLPGLILTAYEKFHTMLHRHTVSRAMYVYLFMAEIRDLRADSHYDSLPKSCRWAIDRVNSALGYTPLAQITNIGLANALHCLALVSLYECEDRDPGFDRLAMELLHNPATGWETFPQENR